jgi:hypothetical protein
MMGTNVIFTCSPYTPNLYELILIYTHHKQKLKPNLDILNLSLQIAKAESTEQLNKSQIQLSVPRYWSY